MPKISAGGAHAAAQSSTRSSGPRSGRRGRRHSPLCLRLSTGDRARHGRWVPALCRLCASAALSPVPCHSEPQPLRQRGDDTRSARGHVTSHAGTSATAGGRAARRTRRRAPGPRGGAKLELVKSRKVGKRPRAVAPPRSPGPRRGAVVAGATAAGAASPDASMAGARRCSRRSDCLVSARCGPAKETGRSDSARDVGALVAEAAHGANLRKVQAAPAPPARAAPGLRRGLRLDLVVELVAVLALDDLDVEAA